MRKTSEILLLAKNHPQYLNYTSGHPNPWLCSCIGDLKYKESITAKEAENAYSAVYVSIGGFNVLKGFLIHSGAITSASKYSNKKYFEAAHAHWDKLIASLQAQGL